MAVASMPGTAVAKVAPCYAALKAIWATRPQELTPIGSPLDGSAGKWNMTASMPNDAEQYIIALCRLSSLAAC
jgi:hypothetical protein